MAVIPAAQTWKPSRTQVRLASAGGLMGGIVAAGVAVLADADEDKAVVGIITGGVTAGLIGGAILLPLLGVADTCLLVGLLKVLSLLLVLTVARRR